MLNLQRLEQCGMDHSSKNKLVRDVYYKAMLYNAACRRGPSRENNAKCVRLLDELMCHVCVFLTSKPPRARCPTRDRSTTTNQQRWDAMDELTQQARDEARALGVRQLYTPQHWQDIAGGKGSFDHWCFWLERVDKEHRPGIILSGHYSRWLDAGRKGTVTDFWTYLGKLGGGTKERVQYPDPEVFKVKFESPRKAVYEATGTPVDGEPGADATAPGEMIFVFRDDNLYIGEFAKNSFHHASLARGGAIVCGGVVVVKDGEILLLVPATGHYRSTPAEAQWFAQLCPQMNPDGLIMPDYFAQNKWYRYEDFRRYGTRGPTRTKSQVTQYLLRRGVWCLKAADEYLKTWRSYGTHIVAPAPDNSSPPTQEPVPPGYGRSPLASDASDYSRSPLASDYSRSPLASDADDAPHVSGRTPQNVPGSNSIVPSLADDSDNNNSL
jgi:hypothetical protein